MKRKLQYQHRLQTLSALRDAVSAMRSLSAHHFRRVRAALDAARQYRDEMNEVIAEIGIHQPQRGSAPVGLLAVTSDLGLCGDYNSRVSQLAASEASAHQATTIYLVGRRGRTALKRQSLPVSRSYESPASHEGLIRLLSKLADDIMSDYQERRIGRLRVVTARFEGVGHFDPISASVLPIDPVTAQRPLRRSPYVAPERLTHAAIQEFLYITLYELLLDAQAAEHGMRLMAAESALDWLEKTAAATSRKLSAARSEASTQELLDIVSGRHRSSAD